MNQKGFSLLFILFVLLSIVVLGIVGLFTYFSMFLPHHQLGMIPAPLPANLSAQRLSAAPSAAADPTADWKTYTNTDLSFKYPANWVASDATILSSSPKVTILVSSKESSLMNECMQLTTTETKNNLIVKKFAAVTTGAMCSGSGSDAREVWVVPSQNAYSPGISYRYSNTDSNQAEAIFDQILSTFKFTQ